MTNWLLLHYKLPSKPTALRVYVWRKLKRMGGVLLHEAVWVLPETPRTAEQYQWLTAEIQEMGGTAHYWRATSIWEGHDQALVGQFNEQVDQIYTEILKKLEKPTANLEELSQQYQQTSSRDFFHSQLGLQVKEKLTSKRGENS